MTYDFLVVGGGFYGCRIALLARRYFDRVAVVEAGDRLMGRASYANQARVHRGYHYPRSYLTASRSLQGSQRFAAAFPACVDGTAQHLYAIARESLVTPTQFERFCGWVGAPLRPAASAQAALFTPALVEAVYVADEPVFNAEALRLATQQELVDAGVDVLLHTTVAAIEPAAVGVTVALGDGRHVAAGEAMLCTYAGTNELLERSGLPVLPLKHELAEMALLQLASPLDGLAVTVMDGPFFSTLPFPALGLHTLSHVRYTPQLVWHDGRPAPASPGSQAALMLADAARYLPALRDSRVQGSLVEVKAVLRESEVNDGRPILFRRDHGLPGLHVAVGAKIDNVFDILEALEAHWTGVAPSTVVGATA